VRQQRQASPGSGPTRRSVLAGLGGLALGGTALSACGTPLATGLTGAAPSRNQFTFWNLFSGGDGDRMVQMEHGFARAHRDIKLSAITLTWGNPYYTKLSLATRGGRPPDVAVSHLTRMQTLSRAGLLAPIDEKDLARFGMTPDKFTPLAWKNSHVDGKLYAVPIDTHPYVLYYNTKICKRAGLLKPDGTLVDMRGPDDLLNALRRIKKVTGKYGLVMATVNDTSSCWRVFATFYWQQGGQLLADSGAKIVLDDDKAVKALELIKRIAVDEKLMPPAADDNATVVAFSNGQAGFLFDGEWDNSIYTGNKTPYNMTRFPFVFDSYTCQADSHTLVLPKDSSRDSGRLDQCLTFIKSMLDQSYTWAQGGHIPAWLPTKNSSQYHRLKPQSNYAGVADLVHYDDEAWYSGSGSDLENVLGGIVSALILGSLSPKAALAQMRSNLQTYADTPSPLG
jgi:multiple sugar transport system substrate-binding protein